MSTRNASLVTLIVAVLAVIAIFPMLPPRIPRANHRYSHPPAQLPGLGRLVGQATQHSRSHANVKVGAPKRGPTFPATSQPQYASPFGCSARTALPGSTTSEAVGLARPRSQKFSHSSVLNAVV